MYTAKKKKKKVQLILTYFWLGNVSEMSSYVTGVDFCGSPMCALACWGIPRREASICQLVSSGLNSSNVRLFFFFLIYFLLEDNCFTMLWWLLPNNNANQPQFYIYHFLHESPSLPVSHLSRSSESARLGSLCYIPTSHHLLYTW